MTPNSPETESTQSLLRHYAEIIEILRARKIVRSSNNPVADYAETLASRALGLQLVGKSTAGHDAVDGAGIRYQIKSRRPTAHNKSRQLSFIRKLEAKPFDRLIGILFNPDFTVLRACCAPVALVQVRSSFVASVNGYRFWLHDDVWDQPGVSDITDRIAAAALAC